MNKEIMSYTTLFYFMNEKHALVEIKRNDISDDSEKDKLYYWLSINTENKMIEKLRFKSMGQEDVRGNMMNIRTFDNAELRFDTSYAKFVIKDTGYILMNCSEELLPSELDHIILDYLQN